MATNAVVVGVVVPVVDRTGVVVGVLVAVVVVSTQVSHNAGQSTLILSPTIFEKQTDLLTWQPFGSTLPLQVCGGASHVSHSTLHDTLAVSPITVSLHLERVSWPHSSKSGTPLQSVSSPRLAVVAATVVRTGHVSQRTLQFICNVAPNSGCVHVSLSKIEQPAGSAAPLHVGTVVTVLVLVVVVFVTDVAVVVVLVAVVVVPVTVVVVVVAVEVATHESQRLGHSSRNRGPLIVCLHSRSFVGHSSASNAPLHVGLVVVVDVAVAVVLVPVVVVVVDVVHVLHKAGHCTLTSSAKSEFSHVSSVNNPHSAVSSAPLQVATKVVVVGATVVVNSSSQLAPLYLAWHLQVQPPATPCAAPFVHGFPFAPPVHVVLVVVVVVEVNVDVLVAVVAVDVVAVCVVSTHEEHNKGQCVWSFLPIIGFWHPKSPAGQSSGSNFPLHRGASVIVVVVEVVVVLVHVLQSAGHDCRTSAPKTKFVQSEDEKPSQVPGSANSPHL